MFNRRKVGSIQSHTMGENKGISLKGRPSLRGPWSVASFGSPRIRIGTLVLLGFLVIYLIFFRGNSEASLSLAMDGVFYSYLQSQPTSKIIPRFNVNADTARGQGSKEPVLLDEWNLPPGTWTKEGLVSHVGDFPQYLKDSTVQLLKTKTTNIHCILPVRVLSQVLDRHDLLFFTNNKENEAFMKELPMPPSPKVLEHIDGFQVFSVMGIHKSHSFHRHGESWLGQIEGRRQWWFLPPDTNPPPSRVNACGYLTGEFDLPPGTTTIIQEPGTIVWFPHEWYHATCALDDWSVGLGAQKGRTIRQNFERLDPKTTMTTAEIQSTIRECLEDDSFADSLVSPASTQSAIPEKTKKGGDKQWQWFNGDLNAYYNSLEKDHNRDPNKISDYAIHRWLGQNRSTEQQYLLLNEAAMSFMDPSNAADPVHVLDGGCGLGSGLMWMEQQHPSWKLEGYTVSEDQYSFIEKLPKHNFKVHLQSYDDLDPNSKYDFIYSIEALIHSPNATRTIEIWASHLNPGGVMAILDDFVVHDQDKQTDDMQDFAKSWLANSLYTTTDLGKLGKLLGMEVVQNRDLVQEFDIIGLNYRNIKPEIHPFGGRVHQGWMGSKWRQRLTVEGKIKYNLLVMKKTTTTKAMVPEESVALDARRMTTTGEDTGDMDETCEATPIKKGGEKAAKYTYITPQLMSGRGNDGGEKIACISGWYCCNKGKEWWDHLNTKRTDNTAFLKLDHSLFGHYIESFTRHLNDHFANHPSGIGGRFLDIGGTGSTASGMTQVTSKFQHFAGPLEYWKLDSDPAAKGLERTLYCDIEDCPDAETCGFDITFSHTVLEHASRPWLAFDTVARITKRNGLTMHLVPFSYQYHATPDDNYRFSHKALISLLEDRGFEVLEVGYDICTKPENMKNRIDEHYETIWLTYVVGRKL